MHVDNTQVTVDKIEDLFKDLGPAIIGNIVSYNSSSEEEETMSKEKNKDEGVSFEKVVEEAKVTTAASAHITSMTPSTPQAPTLTVPSNDEVEAQNLLSSLSKLFEKKKSIKSMEKTLTIVLYKLEKLVKPVEKPTSIQ